MATIKAIEGGTVHQIQSGQVIVDLCSVVKELVENSLDAGATSIDVRFKNQGLDAIEVQDNGDGISPHNYETLALKHHTSKLSTYSDLTTLQTFGFRGEALSSLCALSKFSVITCLAQDAPKGTRLDFATSGKLTGTSVVAAQKGTTVSVENLFNNLPVRRRELERNIKREWGKVVGVLGQYACIQTGIKFFVSQQAGKGKKTSLFSTKGNQSTRENIVNVFGAKTLTALIALDLNLELEPTSGPSQRWSTQEDGGKKDIRIVGHISRPTSGEGRQTPDRQMFFVNARPCGLPQVAKAFNEVYKTYNGSQSPFIFANIELDTHMYDVNVSPDKRTILLHDQNRMLETLKEALTARFESQDYTVPISQLPGQKQPSYKQLTISRENTAAPRISKTPAKTPAGSADVSESEDGSKSFRKESTDDEGSGQKYNPQFRRGAVSRETMRKNAEAVSLIFKWAGRKSERRTDQEAEPQKPGQQYASGVPAGLSDDKRRLVEKLRREGERRQFVPETSEDPDSSVTTSQSSAAPASAQPLQSNESVEGHPQESPQDQSDEEPSLFIPQDPIPALQSPSKPTPSLADKFTNTPRSYRAPPEIATITIGDHTITSSIGTPCPTSKRARTDHVSSTAGLKARSQVAKSTLPSFGNILSQRFSAPGTAPQPPLSGEEVEDEMPADPESPQLVESDPEENGDPDILEVERDAAESADNVASGMVATEEDIDSSAIPADIEDGEVISDDDKKALEEAKVEAMIQDAEKAAMLPSQENMVRTKSLLKGGSKKKDSTLNLVRNLEIDTAKIREQFHGLEEMLLSYQKAVLGKAEDEALDSTQAEEKLSLTISKDDFAKMKIVGQFNLGFILASRASESKGEGSVSTADDLFIIDQHASDEKYNFERLQSTTIVQSQRLVYPKVLDLTALEEEIVLENLSALEANGFIVTVDESGESPVGKRCQLVSLPLSRETAFSVTDLEELIALLAEHPPGTVPRPSKVRKMFAMRACRSSIMIGKTLTQKQMERVVKHLGELDKPWNCPHGRPTMRHLSGLGVWDDLGWKENYDLNNEMTETTDWAAYVRHNRDEEASQEDDLDEIEE
ncbi:hypothetical protein EG329_000467 [Mollisiaceae sp. DMI_Dod_QoI]|nr:hypothetical protein EG329_000467 [Helotiales sp. DMI_Dod_QoI]